eukprot:350368_1
MEKVFGLDDPDFSDRIIRITEGEERPAKRSRQSEEDAPIERSETVHVSKWVLSSQSGYFRSLFGKAFAESEKEEIQIDVGNGETDAFINLLRLMYQRAMPDSESNISLAECDTDGLIAIIRLADMFQVRDSVWRNCVTELKKRKLSIDACESLLAFPDHVVNSNVFKESDMENYISDSLSRVSSFAQCNNLSAKAFSRFVKCVKFERLPKNTNICNLYCIFYRWQEYHTDAPNDVVDNILEAINFNKFDFAYLTNVVAAWKHW